MSHDRVQTSIAGDKFGNCICSAVDTEAEIDALIDELCDLKEAAKKMIADMCDTTEQEVLYDRYFMYLNMTQISGEIGRSVRQTQRIHGNALTSFGIILSKSIENATKAV